MVSLDEAKNAAVECAPFLGAEKVEVLKGWNRASADDVLAGFDHPRWDKSAMDGFGFRAADTAGASPASPIRLRLTETLTAGGEASADIGPGEAVRIMTGAVIPPGTDAVAPLEEAHAENGFVFIRNPAQAGQYIRKAGDEVGAGSRILDRGEEIRATHIESLTLMGRTHVEVGRRPLVAIFSTGDEVVEPEDHRTAEGALGHGQFYCSINYYMAALVMEAGGVPLRMGIAEDTLKSTSERVLACANADAVIITGGTGKGDKDLVAPAMTEAGVEMVFKNVDMWPGTYSAFGLLGRNLVFNIPGNPSAAHICYELFVRPALRRMAGYRDLGPRYQRVTLGAGIRVKAREGLPNFVRGRVVFGASDGRLIAMPWKSEDLPPSRMNAFLVVPAGTGEVRKGESADVLLFSPPQQDDPPG